MRIHSAKSVAVIHWAVARVTTGLVFGVAIVADDDSKSPLKTTNSWVRIHTHVSGVVASTKIGGCLGIIQEKNFLGCQRVESELKHLLL